MFFNVLIFPPCYQNIWKTGTLNVRLDPRKLTSSDSPDVDFKDSKVQNSPNDLHAKTKSATVCIKITL